MKRFHLLYVAPTLLLLAVFASSLISGSESLYFRDSLSSHYPLKAAQAQLAEDGAFLPLIDPYRSGGQPALGNPNSLPLYPTNLLYRIASPLWSLNAHFWLHWLLAPWGVFWLGRRFGLSKAAAWAGGICYATSGYFLSLMNLYNLVSGALWVPLFAAACLATVDRKSARPTLIVGALWALLILAGDPMTSLLGLAIGLSLWLVRRPSAFKPAALSMTGSLALGTLVAAPMWVEMLRILPMSYRGYWRYSMDSSLTQSWNPWSVLEWIVPLFFGYPDYYFWGYSFFGSNLPLIFSLFPGVFAVALVLSSGRPGFRSQASAKNEDEDTSNATQDSAPGEDVALAELQNRGRLWAWAWILLGLFVATGSHNPLVRALYELPGASMLRYPVKVWLAVAVAASILAAFGFERFLVGTPTLKRILGWTSLAYALLWGLLLWMPPFFATPLKGLEPRFTQSADAFRHHRLLWTTSTFFILLGCLLLWLILRLGRDRDSMKVGALLLAVHIGSQCFLLGPLIDGDDASHYQTPPKLAEALEPGARLMHGGGTGENFGARSARVFSQLPGPELFWLIREDFASLSPPGGIAEGWTYELNPSPEGLDSFFSMALSKMMPQLDDASRVRLAAALGVDTLLLNKALDLSSADGMKPIGPFGDGPLQTWAYHLNTSLPSVALLGRAEPTESLNDAVKKLVEADFDPREQAVLAAGSPSLDGPSGEVEIVSDEHEQLVVDVRSEEGGILVTRRSWLPIYRAFVDGEPATVEKVNIQKAGVVVPAGEHRVELSTDRRPTYGSLAAAILACIVLAGLGRREGWGIDS